MTTLWAVLRCICACLLMRPCDIWSGLCDTLMPFGWQVLLTFNSDKACTDSSTIDCISLTLSVMCDSRSFCCSLLRFIPVNRILDVRPQASLELEFVPQNCSTDKSGMSACVMCTCNLLPAGLNDALMLSYALPLICRSLNPPQVSGLPLHGSFSVPAHSLQ